MMYKAILGLTTNDRNKRNSDNFLFKCLKNGIYLKVRDNDDYRLRVGINRKPNPEPLTGHLTTGRLYQIFSDTVSGSTTERKGLDEALS
jgi:hypothetical protein